jgi:hypothetical protein
MSRLQRGPIVRSATSQIYTEEVFPGKHDSVARSSLSIRTATRSREKTFSQIDCRGTSL